MRNVPTHSGGNPPRSQAGSGKWGSTRVPPMRMNRGDSPSRPCAAGGAMVLGFWLPRASGKAAAVAAQPWYRGSKDPEINAWLTIAPDDTVTIRVAQSEIGTGVFPTCPMMIAEELECDWSKVRAEYASANRNAREKAAVGSLRVRGSGQYDPAGGGEPVQLKGEDGVYRRMGIGSSGAVRESRYYLQQAGAEARERLLLAAAQEWGVAVSDLVAKNSVITHAPSGRKTTYGKLAAKAAQLALPDPSRIKIKTPDQFTLMGTEQKNLDVPLKVTGEATFGIDIRLPGMLCAAVKACPVWQGDVKSYDFGAIKHMPGVHSAVPLPVGPQMYSGGVAVVADSWWRAKTALDAMPVQWDYGRFANVSSADLYKECFASFERPGRTMVNVGDIEAGFAKAAKLIEATYQLPYLSHFCMEPGNATAIVTAERAELWCGDQVPDRAHAQVSKLTGIPPENVYRHATFIGGGFGGPGGWGTAPALPINSVLPVPPAPNRKPGQPPLGRR